jgi:hypothetical protein
MKRRRSGSEESERERERVNTNVVEERPDEYRSPLYTYLV